MLYTGDSVMSRSVGGIIFENWLNGRKKAIVISPLANSKSKLEDDLLHIGAPDIDIHPLNKVVTFLSELNRIKFHFNTRN